MRFLATLFLAAFLAAAPAWALLDENTQFSESEKVGFAFYKLGHIKTPDFREWVMLSDAYNKAEPLDRVELLRTGPPRLEQGLYSYHPDEDLIRVMAVASLNRRDAKKEKADGMRTIDVNIDSGKDGNNDLAYFPFRVGKMWVAIVPKNVKDISHIAMEPADYDAFLRKARFAASYNPRVEVIIDLRLRPVSVDTKMPIAEAGEQYWPMVAEIGSAVLMTKSTRDIIWSYQAPWYVSKDTSEILDLFGK